MLKERPTLKKQIDRTIRIPVIDWIDSPCTDELPSFSTITEAKHIVAECEHIINDIALQREYKLTSVNLAHIKGDEDDILQQEAEYNLWLNKAIKKWRTLANKKYIYEEALLQAGVEL